MTRPLPAAELRRSADCAVIYAAFKARMPHLGAAAFSQMDVAELCRLDGVARHDRNRVVMRDQLMTIAVEWNLDRDLLSEQSNVCIHEIAELLRPQGLAPTTMPRFA